MEQTMNVFPADDGHLFIRLDPGDLLLESISQVCVDYEIDSGTVVSGVATLRNLNFHYVPTDEFPKEREKRNKFLERDGAWEVGTIDGAIVNGDPHLHLVAYNGEETVAGHLEPGTEVHLLSEIVIRKIDSLSLERRRDDMNISKMQER